MGGYAKHTNTPPTPADEIVATERHQAVGSDRRVVRTVDLTDEEIAEIEASEMAPGFEYLNAEVDDV